jgi:hypothetical protein
MAKTPGELLGLGDEVAKEVSFEAQPESSGFDLRRSASSADADSSGMLVVDQFKLARGRNRAGSSDRPLPSGISKQTFSRLPPSSGSHCDYSCSSAPRYQTGQRPK